MDLQNVTDWLLYAGRNQIGHTMAVTHVSFYSGPEKKILTFRILPEILTKEVLM